MNLDKWLKRKYPNYYKIINTLFTKTDIKEYLKEYEYDLAILIKDVGDYKKGTIFLCKKRGHMEGSYWDGTYDIYGLFCCGKKITSSGYNHISVYSEDHYMILDKSKRSENK